MLTIWISYCVRPNHDSQLVSFAISNNWKVSNPPKLQSKRWFGSAQEIKFPSKVSVSPADYKMVIVSFFVSSLNNFMVVGQIRICLAFLLTCWLKTQMGFHLSNSLSKSANKMSVTSHILATIELKSFKLCLNKKGLLYLPTFMCWCKSGWKSFCSCCILWHALQPFNKLLQVALLKTFWSVTAYLLWESQTQLWLSNHLKIPKISNEILHSCSHTRLWTGNIFLDLDVAKRLGGKHHRQCHRSYISTRS